MIVDGETPEFPEPSCDTHQVIRIRRDPQEGATREVHPPGMQIALWTYPLAT
jgi:hypothetical protein